MYFGAAVILLKQGLISAV